MPQQKSTEKKHGAPGFRSCKAVPARESCKIPLSKVETGATVIGINTLNGCTQSNCPRNSPKTIFDQKQFALKFDCENHCFSLKPFSNHFETIGKTTANMQRNQLNDHGRKFAAKHLHMHVHQHQSQSIFHERMQRPASSQLTVVGLVHSLPSKTIIVLSLKWCFFIQTTTSWLHSETKECSNGATVNCSHAVVHLLLQQIDCLQLQLPLLWSNTPSNFRHGRLL